MSGYQLRRLGLLWKAAHTFEKRFTVKVGKLGKGSSGLRHFDSEWALTVKRLQYICCLHPSDQEQLGLYMAKRLADKVAKRAKRKAGGGVCSLTVRHFLLRDLLPNESDALVQLTSDVPFVLELVPATVSPLYVEGVMWLASPGRKCSLHWHLIDPSLVYKGELRA